MKRSNRTRFAKRLAALALVGVLGIFGSAQALATATSSAQSKKQEATENLEAVESEISDLEKEQSSLQAEIDALDAELVTTIANISMLEDEIAAAEEDLAAANAELVIARETEAEQYASMKERISYMYVNGGDLSFFQALMGATSFAEVLNRVQMFASVYSYDRQMLAEYQETVAWIETLIVEIEEEEAVLRDEQADLEDQQATLNAMIEEKSAEMDDFDSMLAAAQALAAQYKETIQEQQAILAREAAEAAAAAAAAAAEEAAKAAASSNNASSNTATESSSASTSGSTTTDTSTSDSTSESSSSTATSNGTGVSGQAVADYACQFVGNPYVWGGTSLTDGADCSGFVMSVYAHFGISLPHSSYALRSVGIAVSVSDLQPGDIICYAGHVAIYIGGGAIVHASNATDGIKITYNYAYQTVVAIRRVV